MSRRAGPFCAISFPSDTGGWLQNTALLDRLAREKLAKEADRIGAEGWKWSEFSIDFPYGHTAGLRRLPATQAPLTEEEQARHDAVLAEYGALSDEYEGVEELPEEVDRRLGELEQSIAAVDERLPVYDPADMARAGVFVSLDYQGALKIEGGYIRPDDEARAEAVEGEASTGALPRGDQEPAESAGVASAVQAPATPLAGAPTGPGMDAPEEDDIIRPLSDRLVTELTADRTLALRDALANEPNVAFQAVLHALCLGAFYHRPSNSCLEITAKNSGFGVQAPGLAETASAKAIDARHEQWTKQLPEEPADLWAALTALGDDSKTALVRALRLSQRQCREGAVEPASRRAPARRSAFPCRQSRHGRRRLDADSRELSWPSAEGPHHRGGARSEGREVGAADRAFEEN